MKFQSVIKYIVFGFVLFLAKFGLKFKRGITFKKEKISEFSAENL